MQVVTLRETRASISLPDPPSFQIVASEGAYVSTDGVYFDVERHGDRYGKLGIGRKIAGQREEGDNQEGMEEEKGNDKRSPRDFALWKFSKAPDEPSWPSPWGPGRPGWHIECSAMTHALFGERGNH